MNNGIILRKLSLVAILVVGFAFVVKGHTLARTDSVAGEWDAEFSTPGGTSEFKLLFKVDGEKLTGTVKRARGDSALEGTIKGNDIQFSYTITYGDRDLTLTMTGKVDGDTMKGVVYFGESGQSSDWSAKRAPKD